MPKSKVHNIKCKSIPKPHRRNSPRKVKESKLNFVAEYGICQCET